MQKRHAYGMAALTLIVGLVLGGEYGTRVRWWYYDLARPPQQVTPTQGAFHDWVLREVASYDVPTGPIIVPVNGVVAEVQGFVACDPAAVGSASFKIGWDDNKHSILIDAGSTTPGSSFCSWLQEQIRQAPYPSAREVLALVNAGVRPTTPMTPK